MDRHHSTSSSSTSFCTTVCATNEKMTCTHTLFTWYFYPFSNTSFCTITLWDQLIDDAPLWTLLRIKLSLSLCLSLSLSLSLSDVQTRMLLRSGGWWASWRTSGWSCWSSCSWLLSISRSSRSMTRTRKLSLWLSLSDYSTVLLMSPLGKPHQHVPYMCALCALYVCFSDYWWYFHMASLINMPCMHALYVCLTCLICVSYVPYVPCMCALCALYVCLTCLICVSDVPYMCVVCALYVCLTCLICVPYMQLRCDALPRR